RGAFSRLCAPRQGGSAIGGAHHVGAGGNSVSRSRCWAYGSPAEAAHLPVQNEVTGVQRAFRRAIRAAVSSASKLCGCSGKSSGGRSSNVLTFTVIHPPPGPGKCAPIYAPQLAQTRK